MFVMLINDNHLRNELRTSYLPANGKIYGDNFSWIIVIVIKKGYYKW